jgi:hypothetical protein
MSKFDYFTTNLTILHFQPLFGKSYTIHVSDIAENDVNTCIPYTQLSEGLFQCLSCCPSTRQFECLLSVCFMVIRGKWSIYGIRRRLARCLCVSELDAWLTNHHLDYIFSTDKWHLLSMLSSSKHDPTRPVAGIHSTIQCAAIQW